MNDDEIIDLEEMESDIESDTVENQNNQIETPKTKKEDFPFSFNKNKFLNKKNDGATANKLQNIGLKNNAFPNVPLAQNNQGESAPEQALNTVKKEVGKKAIEVASRGALNGKTAEALSSIATNLSGTLSNKYKKYIIIAAICISAFLLMIVCIFVNTSTDEEVGQKTYTYVTGESTEDELIDELEYYGYCKDNSSCKQKGIYKFYKKLKELYEDYQEECSTNVKNNEPCGVVLNTGLIIETINYYQNSTSVFDTYDSETSEEESDEDFSLLDWASSLFQSIKKTKEVNTMLDNVKNLALAQTEYVKETCEGKTYYYYQISFNKYISYLKYGDTSTHPNYSGKPVEITNDTCQGPQNDVISTYYNSGTSDIESNDSSDSNSSDSTTDSDNMGVQIVNYAKQFVGNPYVWGGTSLTNGADCSGFTMKVFEHFGIYLPHSSSAQANYGTNIGTDLSNALPGDLIVYNKNSSGIGHVAIYMGNNNIVHAKGKNYGIVITNDANKRSIKAIVRLWR
jgi:cell wall-associated NlpC family hydrolase